MEVGMPQKTRKKPTEIITVEA